MVKFVASNLRVVGYEVLTAGDGESALEMAETAPLDLIILDLMLPGINGFEVCRRLRSHSEVPIVVLSAKGEESDKVDALNLGADDYLTKPFGVEELLARVRAVLRRTKGEMLGANSRVLTRGVFELDPEARQLAVSGRKVKLTRTEFDLLHCLMRHPGKVVPHNVLLGEVWGPEYRNQTEYLRVYVGRLRQKIEPDPTEPCYILTEPGLGYLFQPAPV
jgi:two-component system KDP operon response regulator KdpE